MKTIVVSAVNLRKGGTLTILRDCLAYLATIADRYHIVALVHDKNLAPYPGIEYIEIPWSMRNWINRLWCEYYYMGRLSRTTLSPVYLWLSLHDTTPSVKAERRAVYCHNPFAFSRINIGMLRYNYKIVLFTWLSKYIYKINLKRNRHVVVQQQWLKDAFIRMFGVDGSKIIVAKPESETQAVMTDTGSGSDATDRPYIFLFPSFPDAHKNFECLCEASRLLSEELGHGRFEVMITMAGTENSYAKLISTNWGSVEEIKFVGFVPRQRLYELYATADCLVFPSKIETWGLPISEFKPFGKPLLLADLPYAHETAAGAAQASFFDPDDAPGLKEMMKSAIARDHSIFKHVPRTVIPEPKAGSWQQLLDQLLYD